MENPMLHSVQIINEIRELPPENGTAQYEATGRACAVCPCGLNTGFIKAREACQQFNSHAQENEGTTSLTVQPKPKVSASRIGSTQHG